MSEAETLPELTIGVRTLCDFVARSGDLDRRFTPAPSAQEGQAGHLAVTRRRSPDYQSEVVVSGDHRTADLHLRVRGRIDGLDPHGPVLEEIKTCRGDPDHLADNQRTLHRAQLRTYGALWCRQHNLAALELALVYYDVDSGRETRRSETVSATDLVNEFSTRCEAFVHWARQEAAHRRQRDRMLSALAFPWPDFRPGQRQLAETVYKAMHTGRTLALEAPTGSGKTLGTLFPALRAMPVTGQDKLFWLCARTSGRQLALEAVQQLQAQAADGEETGWRTLELVALDKACEHPDKACHGDSCPLASGFYDRLPAARQQALRTTNGLLDRHQVRAVALAHGVCPYYLSQDLVRWADLVIGDYNYYLDRSALLHALAEQEQWRIGLLVDEAHNLIDRARAMYSSTLSKAELLPARRAAPPPVRSTLDRVNRMWNRLLHSHGMSTSRSDEDRYVALDDLPDDLSSALYRFVQRWNQWQTEHPTRPLPEVQRFHFAVLLFLRLNETLTQHRQDGVTPHSLHELRQLPGRNLSTLTLRNLLPAPHLTPRLRRAGGVVLFSATLRPQAYQQTLLGLPADTVFQHLPPVFSGDQLQVRVATNLSSRFRDRADSLEPLATTLATQFDQRPGNYLAYFSSFAYLHQVADRLQARRPDIAQLRQHSGMSEQARTDFLDRFRHAQNCIGFAVLGGVFGEGIDLPGDQLIGVFIATLGLPQWNAVNEQTRRCLDDWFGTGYDYTYLYPGLQKVIQAAGRVIRSPDDRGVLWLLDDRYTQPRVRRLLPDWWQPELVQIDRCHTPVRSEP